MLRVFAALALATAVAGCGSSQTDLPVATQTARLAAAPSVAVSPVGSLSQRPSAAPSSPAPGPARSQPAVATERPVACASSATGTILGGGEPIVGVRVGSHEGYDRVVFEFGSSGNSPGGQSTYEIGGTAPPYLQDASGLPLAVVGDPVLRIVLRGVTFMRSDGSPSYASRDLVPGFPVLSELKPGGDFEGYSRWFVGLNGPACVQAQTLADPARLVIDLRRQ